MDQAQTTTARIENVSNEVVEMVAKIEGVDAHELLPPLYEVIDPEALDQLFASTPTAGGMEGQVSFSYKGYEVTVCGDGYVSVQ